MIGLLQRRWLALRLLACGVALLLASAALGPSSAFAQSGANPVFKALPRPIHYETLLNPREGPKAVIVYGKNAPWTRKAALAVQKAVLDWSGVKLELADDQTVTSDQTWLLTDAYRKTPLIVLGNGRDNRVIHALATRYLAQSNHFGRAATGASFGRFSSRSWPT